MLDALRGRGLPDSILLSLQTEGLTGQNYSALQSFGFGEAALSALARLFPAAPTVEETLDKGE